MRNKWVPSTRIDPSASSQLLQVLNEVCLSVPSLCSSTSSSSALQRLGSVDLTSSSVSSSSCSSSSESSIPSSWASPSNSLDSHFLFFAATALPAPPVMCVWMCACLSSSPPFLGCAGRPSNLRTAVADACANFLGISHHDTLVPIFSVICAHIFPAVSHSVPLVVTIV